MSHKICLMIVFNHSHNENIPKLERIYRERFPDLDYLVPFVPDSPHIFAVHSDSRIFQAYFAEVYPRIRNWPFTHFVFCADDLILNPNINAENLLASLNLEKGTGYLKEFIPLVHGFNNGWLHTLDGFYSMLTSRYEGILPSSQTAAQLISRHGLPWIPMTHDNLTVFSEKARIPLTDHRMETLLQQLNKDGTYYIYPLVYGYSDFLVVPAESFNLFCHYCQLFAEINLFVEIAIPTALLFSCARVKSEHQTNWHGTELWDLGLIEGLKNHHQGNLNGLLHSFQPNQLYIHPVKISQWGI